LQIIIKYFLNLKLKSIHHINPEVNNHYICILLFCIFSSHSHTHTYMCILTQCRLLCIFSILFRFCWCFWLKMSRIFFEVIKFVWKNFKDLYYLIYRCTTLIFLNLFLIFHYSKFDRSPDYFELWLRYFQIGRWGKSYPSRNLLKCIFFLK
jgi:hypothetical protein